MMTKKDCIIDQSIFAFRLQRVVVFKRNTHVLFYGMPSVASFLIFDFT